MFTFSRAAVCAPMGPSWAVDGAALMLSLYVHRVSWDLTRKEPTVRRGPGVGVGCKLLVQANRADSTPCAHLGRPLGVDKGGRASEMQMQMQMPCGQLSQIVGEGQFGQV